MSNHSEEHDSQKLIHKQVRRIQMPSIDIHNRNLDRLYRIRFFDTKFSFVPGHTKTGEQLLLGVLDKEMLVVLYFSSDGIYLRYDLRPVPWNPESSVLPGQQQNRHAHVVYDAIESWISDLGMTPGDIHIRHFAFPEWDIGIAEWPLSDFPRVQQVLAAGEPLDEMCSEWQQEGRWVLIWKKEYWMTADGEIGDT